MKQPKALNIFVVAEQFRFAAKLATAIPRMAAGNPLFAFAVDVPHMPTAAMTNSAFSLELYFKCLVRMSRKPLVKGHDLEKLFASIGQRDRAKITNYFDAYSSNLRAYVERAYRTSGRPVPDVTLDWALRASKDAFVRMRYLFERGADKDTGWLGDVIAEGARRAILDVHPDWERARQASLLPETSFGSSTFSTP